MEYEKCNISVIICCYNSANRLENTLKYLSNQQLDKNNSWELLIVDNNSNDDTSVISQEIWKSLNTNVSLRVVKESKPGLSNARKKGLELAKGDVIIFCDDDNWLDKRYLHIAYNFMINNPNVGVLGGKGFAVSSIQFPEWFISYQDSYAVGVQNIESGLISNRGFVWGAGMVVRRKELIELYNAGFDSLLSGRKKDILTAGDDSEICKWYILAGKELYYESALSFQHFIEPKRLTVNYFNKLQEGFFMSSILLSQYDFMIGLIKKKKKSFYNLISLFIIALFEKKIFKLKMLIEYYNFTPFVFHKQTKIILDARRKIMKKSTK